MGAQTENSELIKRTFGKYLAMSILITLSATLDVYKRQPLALPTDDPAQLALLLSQAYGVTAMVKGPVDVYKRQV